MDKNKFDPNLDIELPPISDIDISDNFDQPKPEPIVTTKAEEKLPKKSNKLLYVIIAAAVAVAFAAGTLIWLFMMGGIFNFSGLPLRNFTNDTYSIKIPEGYTASQNDLGNSSSDATFVDPYEKIDGTQSKVYIVIGEITAAAQEKYISEIDALYSPSNIEKSKKSGGYKGSANIEYIRSNINNATARMVVYDALKDDDRIAKYFKASIFDDGKLCEIIISAPNENPGLAVDAQKIIDSFTLK